MQRRNLFVEPNLSRGANPSLPPAQYNRKPFHWDIHQDDASGAILATLVHNRHSFTGSVTLSEPFEQLRVTKIRYERTWQLKSSSPGDDAVLMTATHPKWWRRMIEFEMHDQRFIMSSKRRMSFEFVVHRATENLNAPGKRREREKEGELVGEISVVSRRKFHLMFSCNEDLGLRFQLFCTWLVLASTLSQTLKPGHGVSSSKGTQNHHDNFFETSNDNCDYGFESGVGDSGSCGMGDGGGSSCE